MVPGLWSGAWIWQRVAHALQDIGHRVRPLTLSGLAPEEAGLDVGLATHIDDVVSAVKDGDLQDVILVAHCYAGIVAGQVADREPGLVDRTVYVEAFLPQDGRSLLHAFPDSVREQELEIIAEHAGRWPVPDISEVTEGQDLSPEDGRWLVERFVAHPGRTLREPAVLRSPLARQRAAYIVCEQDHFGGRLSPAVEALRSAPTWSFHSIDTGHWPMVSAPGELVAILDGIAREGR